VIARRTWYGRVRFPDVFRANLAYFEVFRDFMYDVRNFERAKLIWMNVGFKRVIREGIKLFNRNSIERKCILVALIAMPRNVSGDISSFA
jgi:hypothetical protein